MERRGFKQPLLIGGATTSKTHTAVKIAPHFREPVVHVVDASRAVPVVSHLISARQKPGFVQQIREEYDRLRTHHAGHQAKLISLEAARKRAPKLRYDDLPKPGFTGVRVDSHAYAGYTIPSAYDSMLGKLITYGKDRREAMDKMSRALSEYMITGVKTTISFQQAILQDPNFRRGVYSTTFIEQLLSGARRELIEEKA